MVVSYMKKSLFVVIIIAVILFVSIPFYLIAEALMIPGSIRVFFWFIGIPLIMMPIAKWMDRIKGKQTTLVGGVTHENGALIDLLEKTRSCLAYENNDFDESPWESSSEADKVFCELIAELQEGNPPDPARIGALMDGLREVSVSGGWSKDFITIKERFDEISSAYGNG